MKRILLLLVFMAPSAAFAAIPPALINYQGVLRSASDAASPAPGSAYFYVVTAKNSLGEEGTKGLESDGSERPNPSPCP